MVGMFYSLAYVCILISSKTLSQPATWEWYDILARAQEHACIPEHSECYKGFGLPIPRQSSTPLPRQTNHSLPANNGVKHPRGLDVVNPLNMKRYPRICCGFCSCDSYCRKHGSCCLSSYESLAHGRILTKNSRYDCVKPESLLGPRVKIVNPVWMVTKCNPKFEDKPVAEWCAHPGADGTFDSLIPVSDSSTTYRNRFCAVCNNVEDFSYLSNWDLEISCGSILQLPDKNLLQTIKEKQCNMNYIPPKDSSIQHECKIVPYSISECNITGRWEKYDPMLEAGCHSFVDPFNQTFANVFCYLCNTLMAAQLELSFCKLGSGDILDDISPPFSAILDLDVINSMVREDTLYCNKYTQFRDEKLMKCRDMLCAPDRKRVNTICVRSPSTNKTCYSVLVKMTYTGEEADMLSDSVEDDTFLDSIELLLADLIDGFKEKASRIDLFIKRRSIVSGAFVEYLVIQLIVIHSSNGADILGNMVHALHKQTLSIYYFDIPFHFSTELVKYDITIFETEMTIVIPGKDRESANVLKVSHSKQIGHVKDNLCPIKEDVSPFKKIDLCFHVKISFGEIPMRLENGILYAPGNLTLSQWEFDINGKDVLICYDDFMILYEHLQMSVKDGTQSIISERVHPKQILSFVCVCLSIVCLLITIAIYTKFSELHSQPGVNNIILCVCLLLAQVFYQFGAGQSSLSNWACALIGGLCHFLWLTMMFCMNVCCIQMFKIFKSPVSLQAKFDMKLTLKYIIYITGSSLFLVAVNLGVSLGTSNGTTSGYGRKLCYISSPMMHLYTFVIPSAFTLAVNFVLFACVVFKINETSAASRELHKQRNYFGAYVRLSSLTGLTWLFGYVFIILKKEALEYLFIICNASQGFFIMVAFILNKRVFTLMRRGQGHDKTLSTNDDGKVVEN